VASSEVWLRKNETARTSRICEVGINPSIPTCTSMLYLASNTPSCLVMGIQINGLKEVYTYETKLCSTTRETPIRMLRRTVCQPSQFVHIPPFRIKWDIMVSKYPPFKANTHSWAVKAVFPCPQSIVEATTILHSKRAAPAGRAATAPTPLTGLKKTDDGRQKW
jgi:hypothetical protein